MRKQHGEWVESCLELISVQSAAAQPHCAAPGALAIMQRVPEGAACSPLAWTAVPTSAVVSGSPADISGERQLQEQPANLN